MASQTKMVIITSNGDLIRQFASNQSDKTRIFELDHGVDLTALVNDQNNLIDLAFLAQLSELNPNSNEIYKEVLNSKQDTESRSTKLAKKSLDLTCVICGDRAIGFNYDVLSCASCKAFFRRNAHQKLKKLRCLNGGNVCSVDHSVRRKCQRCRLERCLNMGMRKDFLLSEEEKQRRRKRLADTRHQTEISSSSVQGSSSFNIVTPDDIDQLMMDMEKITEDEMADLDENIFSNLSIEYWLSIEHMRTRFMSIFSPKDQGFSQIDVSDRKSALISWTHCANDLAISVITYFRQIEEFEQLHDDDRFLLIKYNLLPLFAILKCFFHKFSDDACLSEQTTHAERQRQFFHLCGQSDEIRDQFIKLVLSLVQTTEQDPIILSLLLPILLFSQGLTMTDDQPLLKDPLAIHRAQSYFIQLLHNYLLHKYGETKTPKRWLLILQDTFRIQSSAKRFGDYMRSQLLSLDSQDRIAPLMQTVLRISSESFLYTN